MKRRQLLIGGASLLAAGWWLRPNNQGAPHAPYFQELSQTLKARQLARPMLVIDRQRLRENCARLKAKLAPNRHYRIVAKSLPSIDLIGEVMAATDTSRVMTFHQPFTNAVAAHWPQSDILLGKPMPVDAARNFYAQLDNSKGFDASRQLQWLIDDLPRLQQYLQLAQEIDQKFQINIELDVGLHRGGLTSAQQLDDLLELIEQHPQHLVFSGFMGYDAHVGKLPPLVESTHTSLSKSQQVYRNFIARLQSHFPQLYHDQLTFNGAGSPTIFLHDNNTPLNELSAGSCLLKPTDFDLEALSDFQPAAFIATPVIKASPGLQLPGPLPIGEVWATWDVNRRYTVFTYGGNWLAKPESPAGLAQNSLYGVSSNQMMFNGSGDQTLAKDDYVFFRPTQSEAVLLQFGDLAAIDHNHALAWWPTLEQGHGS